MYRSDINNRIRHFIKARFIVHKKLFKKTMIISFISSNIKTIAGVGGALFLSYAIYFDYKRHKDPFFKQKLKERRRKAAKNDKRAIEVKLLDNLDLKTMNDLFQQCMEHGEQCMGEGKLEEAAEHFAFSVTLGDDPMQVLQFFKQFLPEDIIALVNNKLQTVNQKLTAHFMKIKKGPAEEPLEEPKLPDVPTQSSMQEFCKNCLEKAEKLRDTGQIEKAAMFYSYALNLVDDPQLAIYQFELDMPESMLTMLTARMPETNQIIRDYLDAHKAMLPKAMNETS